MIIEELTIKKTTNCVFEHKCLKDEDFVCGKVIDCINNKVHFVDCKDINCLYKMHYADSLICTCPIRKERYNNYGV